MYETYSSQNSGTAANNYLTVCDNWRELFLGMDHGELIRRFSLEHDTDALYLTYYSERYRVDRRTGMITLSHDPNRILTFNTIMSVYNLFYYSKPGAKVRGEFVPFRLVKRASPFEAAFIRNTLRPLAAAYNGYPDLLDKACRALHGEPIRQGDVGYVIRAFDWMPVTFVFWDGDEEFEAQANILFDADITDFIHEETVCCIASDLVRRLGEESGITKKGNLAPG